MTTKQSGTRIKPRFGDSQFDRDDLADRLEHDGAFDIAHKVRRGECLDWTDTNRARDALDRGGLSSWTDYREERCCDERKRSS